VCECVSVLYVYSLCLHVCLCVCVCVCKDWWSYRDHLGEQWLFYSSGAFHWTLSQSSHTHTHTHTDAHAQSQTGNAHISMHTHKQALIWEVFGGILPGSVFTQTRRMCVSLCVVSQVMWLQLQTLWNVVVGVDKGNKPEMLFSFLFTPERSHPVMTS